MTAPRLFRTRFHVLLLFFWLIACALSSAQGRIDCNALQSKILRQTVHYCVYPPSGYDEASAKNTRYPVLYFLHGLGDNEQGLFRSGGWTLIDDLRRQHKIGDFLIVAPEGRRSFFINSADGSVRYNDFFVNEFIPQIESQYRVRPGLQGRAITGISMGGYGALRFAFAHPEMFSAVSAQSAALMTDWPQDLTNTMKSDASLASLMGPVFGNPIDPVHWDRNNPIALAKKNAANLRKLAIYFNCGNHDDFGFEKGAASLDRELRKQGIAHQYHDYPGDHSSTYFLSHFEEVMEFHSRAFGLTK